MNSNNCKLPNLTIAGVHKAGTTSLYSYLAKHPQICPSFKKEIGFFVPLMFDKEITVENKTRQYRYRKLHRYVKDVYMKNEAFWRKHQRLKQRLRNVYNFFNSGTAGTLRTVVKLRALYERYNKELKVFLESNNYTSLPRWLD